MPNSGHNKLTIGLSLKRRNEPAQITRAAISRTPSRPTQPSQTRRSPTTSSCYDNQRRKDIKRRYRGKLASNNQLSSHTIAAGRCRYRCRRSPPAPAPGAATAARTAGATGVGVPEPPTTAEPAHGEHAGGRRPARATLDVQRAFERTGRFGSLRSRHPRPVQERVAASAPASTVMWPARSTRLWRPSRCAGRP